MTIFVDAVERATSLGSFRLIKRLSVVVLLLAIVTSMVEHAKAEGTVDRAALAELRPGAQSADVIKAYGSRWKPPLPHREGRVLTIDFSDGVVVRMASDGRLGSIRYNWRFGEKNPVLGLLMSARGADVKARFPNVDLTTSKITPFTISRAVEAHDLHVDVELGTTAEGGRYLRSIELFDPAAVYPAKQPMVYPAALGEPGAPFKDANFKLAVISELVQNGGLDIGDPEELYEHVLGRTFDLESEGYESVPEARAYLARYPLTPDLLDKVESLEFDGGAEIYPYINYFWDGEDDEFTIHSLEGVHHLRNLKSVRIISMIDEAADLSPLRAMGVRIR